MPCPLIPKYEKLRLNKLESSLPKWSIDTENGAEVQPILFDLQKAFSGIRHCLLIPANWNFLTCLLGGPPVIYTTKSNKLHGTLEKLFYHYFRCTAQFCFGTIVVLDFRGIARILCLPEENFVISLN